MVRVQYYYWPQGGSNVKRCLCKCMLLACGKGERKCYLDLVNLIWDYFVCRDYASEPVDEAHTRPQVLAVPTAGSER